MKKLFLFLTLVAMVVAGNALAVEKGQIVLNPDPQFERRPVDTSRIDLVNESFEDGVPPAGWTLMTSGESYTWVQSDAQAYSGMYSAWLQWGPISTWQDEWMITPALDTTGFGALFVSFMETGYYWAGYGYAHEILISTTVNDDPAAFTSLWRVTPGDYAAPWLDSAGAEWAEVSVTLANYIGETVYIAVRYEGAWADDWWIDDFRVFEPNAHDVKAISVAADAEIWLAGAEITPQFTIKNVGANAETFAAEMTILFNDAPFYTETVTVDDLGSGEQITVDYPSFICEVGAYDLTGTAVLENDDDPDNNVATASNGCYAQGRTPFGILYTEWGCGPCVPANEAMDEWYPAQGNEACVIRVHVWWPSGTDPMYHANEAQNGFLHGMCPTDVNGVPTLYMDNTWDMWDYFQGDWMETVIFGYTWSATTASPLDMAINYDQDGNVAHVTVNVVDPMATGDYVVYVAITEDGIEAQGPNGEPIHNQVFRWLFPDEAGIRDPGRAERGLGLREPARHHLGDAGTQRRGPELGDHVPDRGRGRHRGR